VGCSKRCTRRHTIVVTHEADIASTPPRHYVPRQQIAEDVVSKGRFIEYA
jgi:hypothetical protein